MIDKADIDIIKDFYSKSGGPIAPGRLCETVATYLPLKREVLKFDMAKANRGETVTYTVGPPDDKTFFHIPVKSPELELEQAEAFLIAKGKYRPVIIFSQTMTPIAGVGVPKKDFVDTYFVCPMYSFHDMHTKQFRLRIEAMEYNMLFYLPKSDEFGLSEGFVRFDRAQVVPTALLKTKGVMLTESALYVMHEWFNYFLTGELDNTLAEVRTELLKRI